MIQLQLSQENFEYDIRGLLMAFYPHEEIEKAEWGTGITAAGPEAVEAGRQKKPWRRQLLVQYSMVQIVMVLNCRDEESLASGEKAVEGAEPPVHVLQGAIPVDLSDRISTKSALKRLLYGLLKQDTGRTLPWGTLTGIRPTKIAMGLLDEGRTEAETAGYMEREYLVSDAKAHLSIDIAKREKRILKDIDYENGYSIYVGIPFCPTTCLYCSFTSYPIGRYAARTDEYVEAVKKELAYTAEAFRDKKLNTVYFGGGTPTTLSAEQLDRLLSFVEENFDFSRLQEFTVEAGRPDSITEDKLKVLRAHKISRISINPQTMKQVTLDLIGRRHTVEQIREVYHMARGLGFDNINMDLILGLPEETIDDVRATMEELKALRPDSITVHSLAIKRAARLNIFWEKYAHMSMENSDETMAVAAQAAAELGLFPYYLYRQKNMAGNLENVGFAEPGKEGIYNILIMEEKQSIVAIGAGATTKAVYPDGRIERADSVKDVELYLSRVDEMIERKRQLFAR